MKITLTKKEIGHICEAFNVLLSDYCTADEVADKDEAKKLAEYERTFHRILIKIEASKGEKK